MENKKFKIAVIILVIFNILICNIDLTIDNYYDFYHEKNPKVKKIKLAEPINKVYFFEPFLTFRAYTGLETGYGFFGPNVSSDFLMIFSIYDENKKLVKIIENVPLKSKEGKLRFTTLNNMFLEKLTDKTNPDYNKYLDIIIKQISKYILQDYPSKYTISTELFLYDYPSVVDYNNGEKRRIILVKNYTL